MKLITATLSAILLTAASAVQALTPLELAPHESEVIARLDVSAVANSRLMTLILAELGEEEVRNGAKVLENLTDLDPFTDIEEFWLFSEVDHDDATILVAKGIFNEEKLIDLIKLAQDYKSEVVDGYNLHLWYDEGDGRNKQGVFLQDDLLAIANSAGAMRALLRTHKNQSTSFSQTEVGGRLPTELEAYPFWGMLAGDNGTRGEFGDISRTIDLSFVIMTIELNDELVTGEFKATPTKQNLLPNYRGLLDGAYAMASLLSEEEPVAKLLQEKVSVSSGEKNVSAKASMELEEFLGFVKILQELQD